MNKLDIDKNWSTQIWVIPGEARLLREGNDWYISVLTNQVKIKLFLEEDMAMRIVESVNNIHRDESRRDRRSLSFKWTRFWYLRRKRAEAKRQRKLTTI